MDWLPDSFDDWFSNTLGDWLGGAFLRLVLMVLAVGLAYLVWLVFPDSPFR